MGTVLILLVAAAVVGALKGLAWFLQAVRDRKITPYEWLEFIEYNLNLILQFLWLYVIFTHWGLMQVVAPFSAIPLGEGWVLVGLAVLAASLYYTFKGKYLTSSLLILSGLLIAFWYRLVEMPALLSFLTYLLVALLGVQALVIAYRGLGG